MKGIYKITSPANEVYIGQSGNIKKRISIHRTKKRTGHRKLAASFLLHGVLNHSFEVVHELPPDVDSDIMDTYEQLYMDLYRGCGVNLLNIKEGGTGKHADETKQLMKEVSKYRVFSPESRAKVGHRKPIIQKSIGGDFIKEWPSTMLAAINYNTANTSICNCLTKRSKTAAGFIWEYKTTQI